MSENDQSSRFSIRGGDSSVYNSVIEAQIAGDMVGYNNITSDSDQRKTLVEAAIEIQQILDQLSKSYPTTAGEKATVAAKVMEEIEKKPETKVKIIKALKAGGITALIELELTNNPVVKILTPMLESLLEDGK